MSSDTSSWLERASMRTRGVPHTGWRGGRGAERQSRYGSRGGSSRAFHYMPAEPPNWTLGPSVDSIELDQLLLNEEPPIIDDVRYIASYNWLESVNPVIAVPGSPPFWAPPRSQEKPLTQDKGDFYRDPNAARYPHFPIEPSVRSMFALNSYLDLGSVDFMACGSTLGNLLRFSRSIPSVFRFDIELIGDTVFFIRKENSPTELMKDVKGYGHTFPAAYTQWDRGLGRSISHQRVISYDFNGIRCLVRFGCDGYTKKSPMMTSNNVTDIDNVDLAALSMPSSGLPAPGQKLQVETKGQEIPQEAIFDIKTRWHLNRIDMEDILPRLWITQTPNFLEAYYNQPGRFPNPQIRDVKPEIDKWEKDNASALNRFHAVLTRIQDVVRDSNSGIVEVSWQGSGPLKITQALPKDGVIQRALPPDLAQKWREESES